MIGAGRDGMNVPDHDDDLAVARAIDAIRSAGTVREVAKLTAAAVQLMWETLARYAIGNRNRQEANRRHMRVVLVLLGVMLIGLGLMDVHVQSVHRGDVLAQVAANQRDLVRQGTTEREAIVIAVYLTAFAACAHQEAAQLELRKAVQRLPAPARRETSILLHGLWTRPGCHAFARGEVHQLKLHLPRSVTFRP